MNKSCSVIITCEHGGNRVPKRFMHLFKGKEKLLRSHRGYDRGSLALAKTLAGLLKATYFYSTISRLLIDMNRSLYHKKLFSEITRHLEVSEKDFLLGEYYHSYRNTIDAFICDNIHRHKRIFHIAVHTFTPVLMGTRRKADIGFLYDPSRKAETELCLEWQRAIRKLAPGIMVRRNYPYHGKTDGLATYFRKKFPEEQYIGVELEINQKLVQRRKKLRMLQDIIIKGLYSTLEFAS